MRDAPIPVLVVDDQPPFRLAARAVVRMAPGFELVGEAASGEDALAQTADLRPRLVLMDINMPGLSGIDSARLLVAEHADITVVLCSSYGVDDLPPGAAISGARAYIDKEELSPAVLADLWARRDEGFRIVGASSKRN